MGEEIQKRRRQRNYTKSHTNLETLDRLWEEFRMLNVFKYAEEKGNRKAFLEALNKHSRAKNSAFFMRIRQGRASAVKICMWGWRRFALADGAIFRRSDAIFRQLDRKNRQLDRSGRKSRNCGEYFINNFKLSFF
jgi:hypothetical protein